MALLSSVSSYTQQISRIQFPRFSILSKSPIPETLFLNPIPSFSSLSIPSSSTLCFCSSVTSSSSADFNASSPTQIFIKGLPLSTSEGRLVKAFSGFGEISQVKLLMDKESGQFLGLAYIWFIKEESAQLAVKEMTGKFFDGRFIYVTIAKPGSSKIRRNSAPYKF